MLPITDYPSVIKENACSFETFFNNKAQYKHFKDYITGLIIEENPNVVKINNRFVNSGNSSCLDKFMIQADWSEDKVNDKRVELCKQKTNLQSFSAVIIDDLLVHKTGEKIYGVYKYWDHVSHCYCQGFRI